MALVDMVMKVVILVMRINLSHKECLPSAGTLPQQYRVYLTYKMLNYFTGKEYWMKTFNILSENNNSFYEESVILSEKICYLNQESPKNTFC